MNFIIKILIVGLWVFATSQVQASLLGCRSANHEAIYQADEVAGGLQLTAQKEIEILTLLDEMTKNNPNVTIDPKDLEAFIDFLDQNSIETLENGDTVLIKPGTEIEIKGSASGNLKGLTAGLYALIFDLVKKSVTPSSCKYASVKGCRVVGGSNAYQAEKVGTGIKVVFQNDLPLDELLDDLSSDSEADEKDVEKIVEAVSDNSITEFKKGDAITITPGTEISFTGSNTVKITGLTKGLFGVIEKAIDAAIKPGACTQVLGCQLSNGDSLVQAEMKGDILKLVAMKDTTVADLLSELPQDEDIELDDGDIEKIIDAVDNNNINDIKKGDSVSVIPGTSIKFSGQNPVDIEDLTSGLYDTVLSAVKSAITPGVCK